MSKESVNLEKRKEFEKFIVPHKLYAAAMKKVDDCIDASLVSADPSSCLITGSAGTGKSTLCKDIVKRVEKKYPPSTAVGDDSIKKIISIFNTSLESGVSIKGVAKEMIINLGSRDTKGDQTDLTLRLYDLLKTCETKLIVLDEFHHLLQRGAERTKELVSDWVKNLMNKTKIPVIIVGTPECEDIIDAYPQLSRRYSYREELKPFEYDFDRESDYIKVLKSLNNAFERFGEVTISPKLSDEQMALAIYVATGGLMDSIRKLLAQILKTNLHKDINSVSKRDFANAYSALTLEGRIVRLINVNPFDLTMAELAGVINKLSISKSKKDTKKWELK